VPQLRQVLQWQAHLWRRVPPCRQERHMRKEAGKSGQAGLPKTKVRISYSYLFLLRLKMDSIGREWGFMGIQADKTTS
jgi:hypothetical protein